MDWKNIALTVVLILAAFSVFGSLTAGHLASAAVGVLIILGVAVVWFRRGYRDAGAGADVDA